MVVKSVALEDNFDQSAVRGLNKLGRMVAVLMAATFLLLATSSNRAIAAEPPNQNDPCSRGGRNICGTNGSGMYKNYKYGLRWFGDFRGAVKGFNGPTFCIDLRFWYPSSKFGYKPTPFSTLKNRDGKPVSAAKLQRMNYALHNFGRSSDKVTQAAMMLYVHTLMGDGAPGEVSQNAIGSTVAARFAQIKRAASLYSGPYTVQLAVSPNLANGSPGTLTVKVVSSAGKAVPGVKVNLSGTGQSGLPGSVKTGSDGVGKAGFTATDASAGVKFSATAVDLADVRPQMFSPTVGKAIRNGQRLVGAASTVASANTGSTVAIRPQVVTQINTQSAAPGAVIFDHVAVSGLSGQTVKVNAALYGPFAKGQIKCDGSAIWQGSFVANQDATYTTEPVTLTTPGYYTYVEWIDDSGNVKGSKTACGEAAETTIIKGAPSIKTQISNQATVPGSTISDSVVVTGLGALSADVMVNLYGPFATEAEISCAGTPYASQTMTVNGDGTYKTEDVKIAKAGYYTYREAIVGNEQYSSHTTECGEKAETTLATATPKVTTKVGDTVVRPGSQLYDNVEVTGLGGTPAKVNLQLFGPFPDRASISCEGTPAWSGTLDVPGDGTYKSPSTTISKAGFYVYRESLPAQPNVKAFQGQCGLEAETSLGMPLILTGLGQSVASSRAVSGIKPTKVTMSSQRINAPVRSVGIDLSKGALNVPKSVSLTGWWKDGAAPGDSTGSILIAGHVDSAKQGAGVFFRLKSARVGDKIKLESSDGKTRSWKVSSVRRINKSALPESIFSREGSRRLVLVTCGGPFDTATGHYRDNIVVTAKPA